MSYAVLVIVLAAHCPSYGWSSATAAATMGTGLSLPSAESARTGYIKLLSNRKEVVQHKNRTYTRKKGGDTRPVLAGQINAFE